jgi:hypothetical protein
MNNFKNDAIKKFKNLKILKIDIIGELNFKYTFYEYFLENKEKYNTIFNTEMPNISKEFFAKKNFKILLNDIDIIIETNIETYKYTIKKGFLTDFASIPNIFKPFVSNDSSFILIPSIIHDGNYVSNILNTKYSDIESFVLSNILFKEMMLYYSNNTKKTIINIIYHIVNTNFGYNKYYLDKHELDIYNKNNNIVTVEFLNK